MKICLLMPTRNARSYIEEWLVGLKKQYCSDEIICYFLDSSSDDDTVSLLKKDCILYDVIDPKYFNHGGTRNELTKACKCDYYVFITQDAFLCPSALERIIEYAKKENVAAVCGRQLPHDNANPIAAHARYFNYSAESRILGQKDIPLWGLKTAFVSNSFSAYKASVFQELGGFPEDVILSEDMHLAARMVISGYKVAYAADACVKHSHNYTPLQEFKRYFDIGVFHVSEAWIQRQFGGVGGEGIKFLLSEFKFLLKNAPLWIPRACVTNLCKIVGYKLGKNYKILPKKFRPMLSMHKAYWSQNER